MADSRVQAAYPCRPWAARPRVQSERTSSRREALSGAACGSDNLRTTCEMTDPWPQTLNDSGALDSVAAACHVHRAFKVLLHQLTFCQSSPAMLPQFLHLLQRSRAALGCRVTARSQGWRSKKAARWVPSQATSHVSCRSAAHCGATAAAVQLSAATARASSATRPAASARL